MSKQKSTVQNIKSGGKVAEQSVKWRSSHPKTDIRYWEQKVFHNAFTRDGARVEQKTYCVRIQYQGRRESFALGLSNRQEAAKEAKNRYMHLRANGWDPTLAKFKPEAQKKLDCTIGEYLATLKSVTALEPVTFEIYATKLRTLVSGTFKMESDRTKFDYVNGGHKAWLNKIHGKKLSKITPEGINKWCKRYLDKASNPAERQKKKVTLNSIIRGSKALFSDKRIAEIDTLIELPSPIPVNLAKAPTAKSKRYRSQISPEILFDTAQKELEMKEPELFFIFVLALFTGLRRDEIDTLTWKQIDWQEGRIYIATTEHTSAKSEESEASVDIDIWLAEKLKAKHKLTDSQFVIESPIEPKANTSTYHHYRCNRLFRQLTLWLRKNGLTKEIARNPIHTLRKEFGSLLATRMGIFAASTALRHGSIELTRQYYADHKDRISLSPDDIKEKAAS